MFSRHFGINTFDWFSTVMHIKENKQIVRNISCYVASSDNQSAVIYGKTSMKHLNYKPLRIHFMKDNIVVKMYIGAGSVLYRFIINNKIRPGITRPCTPKGVHNKPLEYQIFEKVEGIHGAYNISHNCGW